MDLNSLFQYERGTPAYWRETPERVKDGVRAQRGLHHASRRAPRGLPAAA